MFTSVTSTETMSANVTAVRTSTLAAEAGPPAATMRTPMRLSLAR